MLSPNVVKAILSGAQHSHLTLKELLHDLPVSWREQKQKLLSMRGSPLARGEGFVSVSQGVLGVAPNDWLVEAKRRHGAGAWACKFGRQPQGI